ncbi:MAG: DNA-3-methyladenine glycosylase 2 family protein, partial [Nocardioides sp.]
MSGIECVWRPDWPCPVGGLLHIHRRGGGDPTYRIDERGVHWRGIRTPEGTATLAIHPLAAPGEGETVGEVRAQAWG